jgi:hypothetical protein
MLKHIDDLFIEEHEVYDLVLSEYFSGQLLDYEMVLLLNNQTSLEHDITQMLYIR